MATLDPMAHTIMINNKPHTIIANDRNVIINISQIRMKKELAKRSVCYYKKGKNEVKKGLKRLVKDQRKRQSKPYGLVQELEINVFLRNATSSKLNWRCFKLSWRTSKNAVGRNVERFKPTRNCTASCWPSETSLLMSMTNLKMTWRSCANGRKELTLKPNIWSDSYLGCISVFS